MPQWLPSCNGLAWGDLKQAKQANRDSFFFTNIAPQHDSFNRSNRGGIWGGLENLVLEQVATQDIKVSVIGGPVFKGDDPEYRGARVPRDFWKLVAYRAADRALSSACFVLSQKDLLSDIETLDFDPYRLFQVSIEGLEERTSLDFSANHDSDVFRNPDRSEGISIESAAILKARPESREVLSIDDLVL